MPVGLDGRDVGAVVTLRDRTELLTLEQRLDASRTVTDTLRAQAHEFSNRLHTIAGLTELGEHDEVRRFVAGIVEASEAWRREVVSRVGDAAAAALLVAKASQAAERGVELAFAPDARLPTVDPETDPELSADLVTVLGNLIDNAIDAVVGAPGARGRVEIGLEVSGDVAEVRVRDTGPGVASEPGRGGVPVRVQHEGRARRLRRRPGRARARPGAGPAGVPAPRRRDHRCTTTAGPCSSPGCRCARPEWWSGRERARRRRRLHGRPRALRLRRADRRAATSSASRTAGTRRWRWPPSCARTWCCSTCTCRTCSGLEVLRGLRTGAPDDPFVLVVTAADDPDTVARGAARRGAALPGQAVRLGGAGEQVRRATRDAAPTSGALREPGGHRPAVRRRRARAAPCPSGCRRA